MALIKLRLKARGVKIPSRRRARVWLKKVNGCAIFHQAQQALEPVTEVVIRECVTYGQSAMVIMATEDGEITAEVMFQ